MSAATDIGKNADIIEVLAQQCRFTEKDRTLKRLGFVCKSWKESTTLELEKAKERYKEVDWWMLVKMTEKQKLLVE